MIRLFITALLFMFFGSFAWAQPSLKLAVKDTLNRIDKEGLKQGHWIKKDVKGNVLYEGQFENDNPFGKFTYYYSNGKIRSITYFRKKSKEAVTQVFNKEGKKITEGKVVGETKDSTWNYYENDVLVLVENYSGGKKNGLFKKYYQNGKLMDERTYKNDVVDGPVRMYHPNEQLKMKGTLVNGLFQGEALFYYVNGSMQGKGNYLNDFKDGKWTTYLDDGSIEFEILYKKSKELKRKLFNGEMTDYYPSGIPKSKTTYKGGNKNGTFIEYSDVGERKQEEVPATQDGYPAEMKEVIVGQKVLKKGTYRNDKLEGKVIYYLQDGKVEKEEFYKDGVLVK